MRIADVAEFYAEAGGGVKTYIDAKLEAGAQRGLEVVVVAPGPEDKDERRGQGRVVWVKSRPVPGDARYFLFTSKKRLHAALDHVQPEVVEGSSPYGGGWFAPAWPGATLRSLVFHQDPVAALAHPIFDRYVSRARIDTLALPVWSYLARLAAKYDTTVVASPWLAERLRQFSLPRVTSVPFGIDPEPFWAAKADPLVREKWLNEAGVDGASGRLLVAVSRHHPEKRLTTLIQATRLLPEQYALVVFGDGPARAQVERAAEECSRVCLAGHTRDREGLATALASADAFVHGSAAETYGLVVSEAVAAGLPLVVPNVGGASDLADQSYAETYDPGDPKACKDAIERLFARDQDDLKQAVARARPKARPLNQHFDELFAHYERLMSAA